MDINAAVGSSQGLSTEDVNAILIMNDERFPMEERLLLGFADRLSTTPAEVDDAFFDELRRHFNEEQMVELAAVIAQENYRARFNRAFAVGSQKLYCPIPRG